MSLSNCVSERLADFWSKPAVLEEKELFALGSVSESVTNSERVKKFQIPLLENEMCIRNVTLNSISNGAYENTIFKIIYLGDSLASEFLFHSVKFLEYLASFWFLWCNIIHLFCWSQLFQKISTGHSHTVAGGVTDHCCDALPECTMPSHCRRF